MSYRCKALVLPTSILKDILVLDTMVGMNTSTRSKGLHRTELEKRTDLTKISGVLMSKSFLAVQPILRSIQL